MTFLLAMAVLTYVPSLGFKMGFFQYFVNASLLVILAIGISRMSVAPLSFSAGINTLISALGTTVSTAKRRRVRREQTGPSRGG